jgi:hypothetical protein
MHSEVRCDSLDVSDDSIGRLHEKQRVTHGSAQVIVQGQSMRCEVLCHGSHLAAEVEKRRAGRHLAAAKTQTAAGHLRRYGGDLRPAQGQLAQCLLDTIT